MKKIAFILFVLVSLASTSLFADSPICGSAHNRGYANSDSECEKICKKRRTYTGHFIQDYYGQKVCCCQWE